MAVDDTGTVNAEHLRRLLDSELPDPALVLIEGRVEVMDAGDDRRDGALEVISREEFLRRAGRADLGDPELERHAANLSAGVDHIGG
jgi:hypothetical protein